MKTVLKMFWPFKHVADYQRRYETQRELLMQRVAVCNELERQITDSIVVRTKLENRIEELQEELAKVQCHANFLESQAITMGKGLQEMHRLFANHVAYIRNNQHGQTQTTH